MLTDGRIISTLAIGLASLLGPVAASLAQETPVIAIDIALNPNSAMVDRATAANRRLLHTYQQGFAFDQTHHPHVTLLQQFVRTEALDRVYAAAQAVLDKERPKSWTLRAIRYSNMPFPPLGLGGVVVERTEDLHRLQDELVAAVAPYVAKSGTASAFFSDQDGRDIQDFLIGYVANFARDSTGAAFSPHVTIGVGKPETLNALVAEPFEPFTFSPAGASVYQLGTYGAARRTLTALTLAP